jgi:chemotaxis response regulator CheB
VTSIRSDHFSDQTARRKQGSGAGVPAGAVWNPIGGIPENGKNGAVCLRARSTRITEVDVFCMVGLGRSMRPHRDLVVVGASAGGIPALRTLLGDLPPELRPAVDPLFRSAAESHGARVIALVLSGSLDDGSRGLAVVKSQGGIAIVHSEEDALAHMPASAASAVAVDHVIPASEMAAVIAGLVGNPHRVSRRRKDDLPRAGAHGRQRARAAKRAAGRE